MSGGLLAGMDGLGPEVITDAPFGAVSWSFRQVRAQEVSYHGHWSAGSPGCAVSLPICGV